VFVSTLGSAVTANGSTSLFYNPSTNILTSPNTSTLASSAKYADLAERYVGDADYAPGTVMIFGGSCEVTQSIVANDRRVAGVVSTDPAFLMNEALNELNTLPIALTGRVPCYVIGTAEPGDILVSSDTPGYAVVNNNPLPGTMIGKCLFAKTDPAPGLTEVVVGRT
jgi:hypothetical protein